MSAILEQTGGHRNLVVAFASTANAHADLPALTWAANEADFSSLTWGNYLKQVTRIASALRGVGVQPGDRVGILSENRPEWLQVDLGILAAGAVTVAPHAPLSASQVQFQLHDAEVSWLFVSTSDQMAKVERSRSQLPDLRGVVVFDAEAVRGDVIAWTDFLERGSAGPSILDQTASRIQLEDLAGILYTSGTTGNPKGVMLTHGNLLSNSMALLAMSPAEPDDLLLSWLPYTHIYARTVDHYKSILSGMHLFLAPSGDAVPELLPRVQPTHMSSVPRLYEKILNTECDGTEAGTARRLQELFGPRRKWFSSGGAPLPPAIADAYRRAGVLVLQGYGLTETSPVISFNHPGAYKLDTVGPPIPGVEVRIAPDGEILTRGPHVMKGYWKNPAATDAILRDGWLSTGDIGTIDSDGFLKITGRKKEMLILSNGKKIAPTNIEGLLVGDPYIEQAVVCGEGRNFLTALIVPAWDRVRQDLSGEGIDEKASVQELAGHPAVEQLLAQRIELLLQGVSSSEQVRRFVVVAEPFSVAREELTVSLKMRRDVILGHYAEQVAALYAHSGSSQ